MNTYWIESKAQRREYDADLLRFERDSRVDDTPLTLNWGGQGEIRDQYGVVVIGNISQGG